MSYGLFSFRRLSCFHAALGGTDGSWAKKKAARAIARAAFFLLGAGKIANYNKAALGGGVERAERGRTPKRQGEPQAAMLP